MTLDAVNPVARCAMSTAQNMTQVEVDMAERWWMNMERTDTLKILQVWENSQGSFGVWRRDI